jgi:penicillin V acylase-like amidase (Ntn superfamily)
MKKLLPVLFVIAALLLHVPATQACTTILVTDESGRAYHGRTLEYSSLLPMDMTYFPAGTKVVSSTPSGSQGLTFDT